MHGIIFTELRKYVDGKLGGDAWTDLLSTAGLKNRMYLPIQEYPDAEAVALVTAASAITGLDAAVILEDFGEFIAPSLLGMYRTLVKPEWKTLDLLEFTEDTIHKVVRARNPGAKPAELKAVRISPTELHLTYGSQRRLCPVAKGIIKGMAIHFGEEVAVEETQCMHTGADACQMTVVVAEAGMRKLQKASAAATRAAVRAPRIASGPKPELVRAESRATAPRAVPATKPAGGGKAATGKRAPAAKSRVMKPGRVTAPVVAATAAKPPKTAKATGPAKPRAAKPRPTKAG